MLFNLNKGAFTARSFQYSGESDFDRVGTDFMIVLEDSNANGSTLRLFKTIANADICLVAGGFTGGKNSGEVDGDHGGDGGEVVNITGVSMPAGDYTVIVGETDADTQLIAPDGRVWTAESGAGAAGGRSGKGADGSLAWGDANTLLRAGWLYGAGGGRCYTWYNYQSTSAYPGGSIGTADAGTNWGHGGTEDHWNGYPGFPGTGQGGGARARIVGTGSGVQGPGGRGAVLIRKHKEVT